MKIFEHYKTPDDLYYIVLSYVERHCPEFRDSPYRPPGTLAPKRVRDLTLEEFRKYAKKAIDYYMSKTESSTEEEFIMSNDLFRKTD